MSDKAPVALVIKLCKALNDDNISYCHWKSNNALERSANGENDLDLLIGRADIQRFVSVLLDMGFKQAFGYAEKRILGVQDFYGYDDEADIVIHVHAHYQLVLGHDMTKNYRLPVEEAYLSSSQQKGIFYVPAPEFEIIIFIARMAIKHLTLDALLLGEGKLKPSGQKELDFLKAQCDFTRVKDILNRYLPYVTFELIDETIRALMPGSSLRFRYQTGLKWQNALRAGTRYPVFLEIIIKTWRRFLSVMRWRLYGAERKHHLASGGISIAIVGGDGAGKTTVVNEMKNWLSTNFDITYAHMGKPAWSSLTILVRVILKLGQLLGLYPAESSLRETLLQKSVVSPGFPWLIREVCRARDRYNTYVRTQHFSANGSIVIFDRFPVAQIQLMDGPQIERCVNLLCNGPTAHQFLCPRKTNQVVKILMNLEHKYYAKIRKPEILIVLRLDPEIAVSRRPNDDPAEIRERAMEIQNIEWANTLADVFDSSRPKDELLRNIKSLIWSKL